MPSPWETLPKLPHGAQESVTVGPRLIHPEDCIALEAAECMGCCVAVRFAAACGEQSRLPAQLDWGLCLSRHNLLVLSRWKHCLSVIAFGLLKHLRAGPLESLHCCCHMPVTVATVFR